MTVTPTSPAVPTTISNIPAATLPLSGSELVAIVQNGLTVHAQVGTLPATLNNPVSAAAFIPTGNAVPANGINLPSANTLGFATAGVQRGAIDASGRFILGGTSVVNEGLSSPNFQILSTNTGGINVDNWLAGQPELLFGNSAGSSIGTHGALSSGEFLGIIGWIGDDGTNYKNAVSIQVKVDNTVSTGVVPGSWKLLTANASSGSLVQALLVNSTQDVLQSQGTSALSTSATGGFLYIATCSGTPTGVPSASAVGNTPVVYDSSNHKIWVYDNGAAAWKGVAVS